MLQLSRKAPEKTFLSIKKVGSNGTLHLTFRQRGTGCLGVERHEQGVKYALRQLIFNAIREVKSRVPAARLEHVPDLLESFLQKQHIDSANMLTPAATQQLLAHIGEVIGTAINIELGRSPSERNAPRTPSDCLIDWIAFLSKSNLPLASILLQEAKHCWEQGRVNLYNLAALLQQAWQHPDNMAHEALQHKAQSLLAQSAVAHEEPLTETVTACPLSEERIPYTQLHDNLYGRVFDSVLVAYLLHCPPDAVLRATHDICRYLADCLAATSNAAAKEACYEVCAELRSDRRFWMPSQHACERLLATVNDKQRLRRFKRILRAMPRDAGDILLRQCMAVKLMVALREVGSKFVPWMVHADRNYREIVRPQRRRLSNLMVKVGAAQPTGGITVSYQPPILQQPWMIRSLRPLEWYKPNLSNPSITISVALESGMPYASGISGSTNLLLYLANHMKKKCGLQIDIPHVLLSILLFVVYDGGHSIHEAMWIGHYLNKLLDLDLNFEEDAPLMKYVGSIAQFERLFVGSTSEEDIRVAKHMAWQQTLQAFHTYSHYAHA